MRTALEQLRPPSKFTKDNNIKQEKSFTVQDKVYAQVHQGNNWNWVAGEVIECVGRVMCSVWLPGKQRLIRSHSDQLRQRYDDCDGVPDQAEQTIPLDILLDAWGLKTTEDSAAPGAAPPPAEPEGLTELQREFLRELFQPVNPERRARRPTRMADPVEALLRRSSRQRFLPVRYEPYQLY